MFDFSLIGQLWFFILSKGPHFEANASHFFKGGPFGKMKNQSCTIKLKLGQLNYLAKLCIYIKLEHCTFKAGQFAYQPNCPIPFLSKINIEFWDTLFNGPQACDVRILPSKNKIHDGKSFLKLFNLQQVENFEHFHYRIFSERNDSI